MKNYGFIDGIQEISEYILGNSVVPFIYYNDSGSWEEFLPTDETQLTKLREETSACTVFCSLNQIETLSALLYKEEVNYSERFTYLMTGITPSTGANPQDTHECIRKNGVVLEKYLPMTRTIEEYLSTQDITTILKMRGLDWLKKYDYKHEWLWESGKRPLNYIEVLKEALKTSPIAVSVSAWNFKDGVYVSNQGSVNNHYCLLYKIDDEGYPWVFDSYSHSKKRLSKDHNIRRAKRIWLNKKTISGLTRHKSLLERILAKLTMKKTLLQVCEENLGKDASPLDRAKDDVGCSETVTTLLKQVYPETPIILGTATLYEYLKKSPLYEQVSDTKPETIVVSPTGYGNKGTIGHTGIIMQNGLIASNNSFGVMKGKFTQNYTTETWRKRYAEKQGMPVFLFRRKI